MCIFLPPVDYYPPGLGMEGLSFPRAASSWQLVLRGGNPSPFVIQNSFFCFAMRRRIRSLRVTSILIRLAPFARCLCVGGEGREDWISNPDLVCEPVGSGSIATGSVTANASFWRTFVKSSWVMSWIDNGYELMWSNGAPARREVPILLRLWPTRLLSLPLSRKCWKLELSQSCQQASSLKS